MNRLKVVIPRSKWTGSAASRIAENTSNLCKNAQGERCCLGHFLLAYNPLFEVWSGDKFLSMPHECPVDFRPEWLVQESVDNNEYDGTSYTEEIASDVASALAHINDMMTQPHFDNPFLPQDLKEAAIMYVFDMYDVDVEFVD